MQYYSALESSKIVIHTAARLHSATRMNFKKNLRSVTQKDNYCDPVLWGSPNGQIHEHKLELCLLRVCEMGSYYLIG